MLKNITEHLLYNLVHIGTQAKTIVLLGGKAGIIIIFIAIVVINNKEDCYGNKSKETLALLTYVKPFVI